MNYLAHIFLSADDRGVQIGNFIGDAVKGSSFNKYPPAVRTGILLHRAIDSFTDEHPAIREYKNKLRPHFGRYSGALLDIYMDYLLASRFDEFSTVPLRRFTTRFYMTMIRNRRYLPKRIRRFMWHFIATDRLGRYATKTGIGQSLEIMTINGRLDISVEEAIGYLDRHEQELWEMFQPFFSELQAFSREYLQKEY